MKQGIVAMSQDISEVIAKLQSTVNKGRLDIQRYQRAIKETQSSISDAEITLRTLNAMGVRASDDQSKTEKAVKSVAGLTTPDIIFAVLGGDDADPLGYGPSDVMKRIQDIFGLEPDPNNVRPTLWRMAKSGRLQKDERGRYRLPQKNEAADDLILRSASPASDSQPAQGGVARPGGGT